MNMIDLTDDGDSPAPAHTRLPSFASAPSNSFLPAWNKPGQSYHQATLQTYHSTFGTATAAFQQSSRLPSISEGLNGNSNTSLPVEPGVPLVPTYTYHPPGPQSSQSTRPVSAYEANMASRAVVTNNTVTNRVTVINPLSVRFSVIDHQCFTARAETGEVTESIMDCIKRTPGAKFDTVRPQWLFPFSSHQLLAHTLQKHRCSVEMIPPGIIAAAQLRTTNVSQEKDASETTKFLLPLLGEHVLGHLATFQQEAVKFIAEKDGRALIADEMGLGKTRTAIGGAMLYQDDWPVLVVCPSSARYHWQEEIMNILSPHVLDAKEVTVVENGQHSIASLSTKFQYKFVILSYSLVHKLQAKLAASHFGVVIADESHYLKTRKAQRTKALLPLIHNAKRAVLLSGTPALSRPVELFTQLHALQPKVWSDFKAFGKRYCVDPKPSNEKSLFNGHNRVNFGENAFKGANNTQELHVILTSTIMIRRLKKDILKQLPQKKRYFVKVPIEDETDRRNLHKLFSKLGKYEEILKRKKSSRQAASFAYHANDDDEEYDATMKKRKSLLLELYRDSGPAKLPSILKQLKRFLDADVSGGKILVFAHHRVVLDGVCRFLREYLPPRSNDNSNNDKSQDKIHDNSNNDSDNDLRQGMEYIRIDGTTPSSDRHQRTHRFQTDPSVRVAVLGISAAGIALTLTAAHMVFFAELFWTPGSLIQAEDRAHRIGQVRNVKIFYFFADGSIDELLWPMVRKKLQLLGEIVEGQSGLDLAALSKNNVSVQTKPALAAVKSSHANSRHSSSSNNMQDTPVDVENTAEPNKDANSDTDNNNDTNNNNSNSNNNNDKDTVEGDENNNNASLLKKRKSSDNVYEDNEGRLVFDLLEDDDDFDELMNEMVKESTHEFDDAQNNNKTNVHRHNSSSSSAAAAAAASEDDDNDSDREAQPDDDYEEYLKRPFPLDKFALFYLQDLQKKEQHKLDQFKTQYLKQEEMKRSHPHLSGFLSVSQSIDPSFASPPTAAGVVAQRPLVSSQGRDTFVIIDDSDEEEEVTAGVSHQSNGARDTSSSSDFPLVDLFDVDD